jgi:CRP-like cAMP-binding protein
MKASPALDRAVIAGLPTFAGLASDDLDAVLADARSVRYPKGSAVFEQGGEANSFFLLLHGHLQVVKVTPAGQQVVVRYVVPGDLFGIAVQMGRSSFPATATAVVDSVCLVWPASAWSTLVARVPTLAGRVLQTMGARLDEAHTRVVEMSTQEVERRVAHALLRLVKQAGRPVETGLRIDFPITRQDVAEMTGTTLHTVSRILSAWEEQGLVEGGRQKIVVCDPHRLVALAERG